MLRGRLPGGDIGQDPCAPSTARAGSAPSSPKPASLFGKAFVLDLVNSDAQPASALPGWNQPNKEPPSAGRGASSGAVETLR
jgi:hypothetical protein